MRWSPPSGDNRNLIYSVIVKTVDSNGKSRKRMTKSTTNRFMRMARKEEIRDYATAEYRVLAKAPCEAKLPVKIKRSFKDLSN